LLGAGASTAETQLTKYLQRINSCTFNPIHYQHSVSSYLMSNNCSAMFCVRRRRPHLWNVCFRRAAFRCIQTKQECRMLFWKRSSFWSPTSHIFKSLAACYVLLQLTCHQDGQITVKIVAIWSLQIIT